MFAKVSFAKLSTSLSSVLELVKTQTVALSFVQFEGGVTVIRGTYLHRRRKIWKQNNRMFKLIFFCSEVSSYETRPQIKPLYYLRPQKKFQKQSKRKVPAHPKLCERLLVWV